jgi:hypothetical protein
MTFLWRQAPDHVWHLTEPCKPDLLGGPWFRSRCGIAEPDPNWGEEPVAKLSTSSGGFACVDCMVKAHEAQLTPGPSQPADPFAKTIARLHAIADRCDEAAKAVDLLGAELNGMVPPDARSWEEAVAFMDVSLRRAVLRCRGYLAQISYAMGLAEGAAEAVDGTPPAPGEPRGKPPALIGRLAAASGHVPAAGDRPPGIRLGTEPGHSGADVAPSGPSPYEDPEGCPACEVGKVVNAACLACGWDAADVYDGPCPRCDGGGCGACDPRTLEAILTRAQQVADGLTGPAKAALEGAIEHDRATLPGAADGTPPTADFTGRCADGAEHWCSIHCPLEAAPPVDGGNCHAIEAGPRCEDHCGR